MALSVAIQMDPIEKIDIGGDSTFALMLEGAEARPQPSLLRPARSFLPRKQGDRAGAAAERARGQRRSFHFGRGGVVAIFGSLDVVLMRQDPPFDMAYITATHILERIHPRTLVVNDPAHVRNAPEKLFVTEFADFIPPTLITSDGREIRAFSRRSTRTLF